MITAPLVTIVVPTWNRKALVREAIASIIAQTYRNWELVVVDDGSEDGTVLDLHAIGEPRLRVIALEHCGNMARVRNIAAAEGGGELIAFLDSDDLWLPRKLELQVSALRSGSARWCYGNYAHVDGAGRPLPERQIAFRPDHGRILRSLLLGETAAFIGTLLVERRLFDSLGGFDEGMLLRADFDLELRLAAAADAIAVPDLVALVREHPARTTRAVCYPHEASALVFEKFLARETDEGLRRIARVRRAQLLVDAGLLRLRRRHFGKGARLLFEAGPAEIGRRLVARLTRRSRQAPNKEDESAGR